MKNEKSIYYKDAGVDINLAHKLFKKVKPVIMSAHRPEMLAPVGGFGGLFQIDISRYKKPVLVSSIDGVGTKLMIASMMEKYDTIGYDIVNHCINDIAVQGAEPLYFLDYIGIGKLRSPLYENIITGIAEACKKNNCALLGGETAEMPGMYGDDFDLVGVITGIVEADKMITGETIVPGDVVVGIASNGLHTNGYSLARKVLFENCGYNASTFLPELNETIGEALLKPHTCYYSLIKELLKRDIYIKGIAHITGGGIFDNIPRILPETADVIIYKNSMPIPPIFELIIKNANIDESEAYKTFNMGIGLTLILDQNNIKSTMEIARVLNFEAEICGEVIKGNKKVVLK